MCDRRKRMAHSISISKRLRVTTNLASNSCTWTAAVALLVTGMVVMAVSVILLGDIAIEAWHGGWLARFIALILFASANTELG
jgi:hypothetical protein